MGNLKKEWDVTTKANVFSKEERGRREGVDGAPGIWYWMSITGTEYPNARKRKAGRAFS